MRLRRVDRRECCDADAQPEWRPSSGPRRRSASPAARASPRCSTASCHARPAARRPSGRHDRVRLPRRPDQGGRRPRARHPPRPVPAHRHQHVLDQRRSRGPAAARSCSSVNSTGRSLKELRPVMTFFFEFDEVDEFSADGDRRAGIARVLPPRPRRRSAGHREVREATGQGDLASTCAGSSATCRRRRTGRCPAPRARRAGGPGVRARTDRPRLRPQQRPAARAARGAGRPTRRRRRRRGSRRRRATIGPGPHPASTSRAARPTRSATTPTRSSPPAARRACGAATRSTPTATRVHG